jgi:hypothetical protein
MQALNTAELGIAFESSEKFLKNARSARNGRAAGKLSTSSKVVPPDSGRCEIRP